MFEKSRCVFCNRITDKEDIMFRYPSSYGKVAEDHQYTCMQRAHNIVRNNDCVMPLVYFRPDSNELNGSNKEGSYSVFVKDGTELTQMICPTCHGMLFRDTDDGHRNTYLFFGEKDSGKTSLIYAIIYNGVIRKEHPMTIDGRYIPFYNDYLMPKNQLERTYNDIVRSKITKPKSLEFPFIIHRAAAAHSGLTNKTDVFYDVTDFDIQDGNHIDMTLRQAQQATAFVFTIVYFVTKNVNLFDIPHDSFVFDLTSNDPEHQRYYGIDEERYQRCLDIIRTFNLNGDKEFVKYLNAILPKLDSASAFSEDTLEEIYHLYCFTNINDINKIEIGNLLNQVLVESIFKYYFIVDDADKPTFEDSINKYFQKLLFLVNLGKYCSSDISGIINVLKTCENYYPHISTTLRLVLCQSWTNVISHFVSLKEYDSSTDVFLDYIFDDSNEKSQLISDILDDCLIFYIRYRSENADIGKLTEVALENKLSKILIYQRYLKNTLTAENFDVFDKEALYSYIFFVRDIMIRAQDEKIKATLGDNCMTAIIQFIKKDVIADLYGRSIVNLMEAADTVELIDAVSLLYNEFRKAIPDYSSVLLTYLLSARCHKAETLLQLLNYKLSAAGINDFDRFVEEDHINTLRLVVNDITKLIDGKITSKYLDMVFAYSDIAEKCQESAPTYSIIDYQKKLDTNCVNKIKTWVRTLITNVKPSMTGCLFVNTDTKETPILFNQENKTKTLTGDLSVFSQPVSEFLCDNRSKTVTQYDKKYVFNCRGALDDFYNSLKISNESDLTAKMMEFMLSIDEFSKNCGGSFPDDYKDDMAEFINSVLFDEQSDKKQAKENEKIINHNDFFKSLLKEYSAKQNSGKSKFGFPFGKNK